MKKIAKKNPRIVRMSAAHKDAVLAIRRGADVRSYVLAKLLREVEATKPEAIDIGPVQMGPYDGAGQVPYFGAIATRAGVQWATSRKGGGRIFGGGGHLSSAVAGTRLGASTPSPPKR